MTRISVRPDVCHGKPCIAGTRIMVTQILDLLEDAKTFKQIQADYFPDITTEDIGACVQYAKSLVMDEEIHLVEESAIG